MNIKLLFCIITYTAIAQPLSQFAQKQLLLPPPPSTASEAYVLMDAKTGIILAEKHAYQKLAPASLTKLMTSYVLFHAITQDHVHLDDIVNVSTTAWSTEGSRLFLNEHSQVSLHTLLKGIIITSANDASVAISEHFAGSEDNFASIMNRYTEKLGMHDSHFVTATGLDHEDHYTTAYDLSLLSQHIINDFPQFFHWFHEKSISHNGITQNNRHNLLNTHPEIDGLKTGHTNKAGYCLATTAQKDNTRLIVISLNAPSVKTRNQDTLALLNYGFRFYETALLYPQHTQISTAPVHLGIMNQTDISIHDAFWATIPKGAREHLNIDIDINTPLTAPLSQSQSIGHIIVKLDHETIATAPLYPDKDIQTNSGLSYIFGNIKLFIAKWF